MLTKADSSYLRQALLVSLCDLFFVMLTCVLAVGLGT